MNCLQKAQGKSVEAIKDIINGFYTANPMMGHRGCRLAVTYPEIAKMQTKAVIRAAINVQRLHADWTIVPEIMIPLIGDIKELKYVKKVVVEQLTLKSLQQLSNLNYEVGTMIEIPRAALTADEIANEADFFCFGTNDLTQLTFGFSRDDAGKFLDAYYDAKIFENDPFAKIDQKRVSVSLWKQLLSLVNRLIQNFTSVSAVNTAATHHQLKKVSATRLVLTMFHAHHSVCQSQDLQLLKLRLTKKTNSLSNMIIRQAKPKVSVFLYEILSST